jgi:hypothetical protein
MTTPAELTTATTKPPPDAPEVGLPDTAATSQP